ncbi:MAG TPA: hypothetical protein VEK08_16995 [Planctomycetota bacterium]|nr:hypothetical protein [Planctomycetota bacterium]
MILVAGVLAVLAALSTGFYTLMIMQTRSATRYSDGVRAELMARAGIEEGIAWLRQQAIEKTEDPTDPWFTTRYTEGGAKKISFSDRSRNKIDDDGDGVVDNFEERDLSFSGSLGSSAGVNSDRFQLHVSDAASRINVNAGDNLAVLLDNLCRVTGRPLVAADQEKLQPRRWFEEGAPADYDKNPDDTKDNRDLYFRLYNSSGALDPNGRPRVKPDGTALYGDGYAIAGYRARHGRFRNLVDVKQALTYVERNGNMQPDDPLEQLEIEVKYLALRDYITIDSWVDTNTVCIGKFEWVTDSRISDVYDMAIDRDKSWVADDPVNDPLNTRGSLRGCYVSIINNHGAGQLRRIKTNGVDWIQIEMFKDPSGKEVGFAIPPGPISSYMIIAAEDAMLVDVNGSDLSASYPANPPTEGTLAFPKTNPDGTLVDNPNIDYAINPLCIHRAPININTASDKVLAAAFMGINVQHGHPMALGTDVDLNKISKMPLPKLYSYSASSPNGTTTFTAPGSTDWKAADDAAGGSPGPALKLEPYLLTPKGLKRIPADTGYLVLDRPKPWILAEEPQYGYIANYGNLGVPDFAVKGGQVNEAHELAWRIITARQRKIDPATGKATLAPDPDPTTADADTGFKGFEKGPFKSWDDLFFRVIKPWDDIRSGYLLAGKPTIPNSGVPGKSAGLGKASIAPMIMAHFNSNTDLLKFNPNIEWIDRWGRNFTEMEPVMVYGTAANAGPLWTNQQVDIQRPVGAAAGSWFIRNLRYKSDEMIDKSDLNRSTTEFSFDSGGIFEIESIGQVMHRSNVLAERKVQALVKVYSVWRESTQRQFAQGVISRSANSTPNTIGAASSSGNMDTGRIVRDAENNALAKPVLKALDTLPEPLVPLSYRIENPNTIEDVVDPDPLGHDAFGRSKGASGSTTTSQVPDILANKVLPAQYDGQIVLATNTAGFSNVDNDSFLASYNGDLDTDTSRGNGREQAKTPKDPSKRTVDTIGLLGLLNDSEIDVDPDANYDIFVVSTTQMKAMQALPMVTSASAPDPVTGRTDGRHAYWNNLSCRVGDLRAEGVYLGMTGTALKDATVKYCYGTVEAPDLRHPPKASTPAMMANFEPGNREGCTISLWFKPSWHATDNREHEFFDGGMLGDTSYAKYCQFYKSGRYSFSKPSTVQGGNGSSQFPRNNDLMLNTEGGQDDDFFAYIHGGTNRVNASYLPAPPPILPRTNVPTPGYETQPFRWSHAGATWKYQNPPGYSSTGYPDGQYGPFGRVQDPGRPYEHPLTKAWVTKIGRPFIDTQRFPEGPDWKQDYLWIDVFSGPRPNDAVGLSASTLKGQPAAYTHTAAGWPNVPLNPKHQRGVFSINNVNEARPIPPSTTTPGFSWIYRSTPLDGTYAVIDELKISKKMWETNRIAAENTLSRYYLPRDPADRNLCPTFTSQTLYQALKGFGSSKAATAEFVTIARVSWTVFTPRFMHEYKQADPNRYARTEVVASYGGSWRVTSPGDHVLRPYRGPFDYCQYNYDIGYDAGQGWKHPNVNAFNPELGVDRRPPQPGKQSHFTRGVEIELLDDYAPISGFENSTGVFKPTNVFVDPDVMNSFVDPANPSLQKRVDSAKLRYRVRFRYPVSPDVDPKAPRPPWVDPSTQYLLDTPVFDDISITYFSKPRILAYREIVE